MNRRLFTLSPLVLSACGGGGSSSPTSKIIRVISDSTGVGSALGPSGYFTVNHPWPSYINVPGYTVVNSSVGGQAMRDVDWTAAIRDGSSVYVICDCINDAFQYPDDIYESYLRKAVVNAQEAGKVAILQTPNPTYEARVTAFAQVMRDVAAELAVPLIDQDKHLREVYSDLSFAGDRMHPSQPAYTVMGTFSNQRLQDILK